MYKFSFYILLLLLKGVYCKAHAPRVEKFALDQNCMEIRNAVAAQRISKAQSFNHQVKN